MAKEGLLLQPARGSRNNNKEDPPQTLTYRQNIIREIVKTERDYVHHLQLLQQFKNDVEERGVIAGDSAHDIFLNLNALLDFQRRFLIRIEQQNTLPENQQNWGQLFTFYKNAFRVYEPFIANQIRCHNAVSKEWDKLSSASLPSDTKGMVEVQSVLVGFLLKPFQRLSKYPMLLKVRLPTSTELHP